MTAGTSLYSRPDTHEWFKTLRFSTRSRYLWVIHMLKFNPDSKLPLLSLSCLEIEKIASTQDLSHMTWLARGPSNFGLDQLLQYVDPVLTYKLAWRLPCKFWCCYNCDTTICLQTLKKTLETVSSFCILGMDVHETSDPYLHWHDCIWRHVLSKIGIPQWNFPMTT